MLGRLAVLASEGLVERKCSVGKSMQAREGRGRARVKKKALEISCPGESMTGCSKWAEEELGQTGAPSTRPYVSFEKCHAVFITNKSPFDYNP